YSSHLSQLRWLFVQNVEKINFSVLHVKASLWITLPSFCLIRTEFFFVHIFASIHSFSLCFCRSFRSTFPFYKLFSTVKMTVLFSCRFAFFPVFLYNSVIKSRQVFSMNDDYKILFEASENARKKQEVIIVKQEKYISELEEKNNSLSEAYEHLSSDYDKALSICDKQQALLDQLFKDNPDL
ncbi:MAG: hypothetical protein ACI4D7_06555, partial [Lachnospiraceae bacterium]